MAKKSTVKARLVEAGKYGEGRNQAKQRPYHRRDRAILFVWAKDEGAGLEQFIYRHNRPVQLYRSLLPEILEKLWGPPDDRLREDVVVLSHDGISNDDGVGVENGACTDLDLWTDHAVRTDDDTGGQFGPWVHNRVGVNIQHLSPLPDGGRPVRRSRRG